MLARNITKFNFGINNVISKCFNSTLTNQTVKKLRKKKSFEDDISFEDFVLKGQVLHVYRDMMRTIRKIPDNVLKQEILLFVKGEYKSTMNVSDLGIKRSLLIGGIKQFKSVTNNLGLSYTDIKF